MMLKQNNLFVTSFILIMILISFDAISGCDKVVNECKKASYGEVMSIETFKGCHNFMESDEIKSCSNYNPFRCSTIEVPEPDSTWNSTALSSIYTFTCEQDACLKVDKYCFPYSKRSPKYSCEEESVFKNNMVKLGNKKNTIFFSFDDDYLLPKLKTEEEKKYYLHWKSKASLISVGMNELLACLGIPLRVEYVKDYKTTKALAESKDIKALWYKYNNFFILIDWFTQPAYTEKGTMQEDCNLYYMDGSLKEGRELDTSCRVANTNRSINSLAIYGSYPRIFSRKDSNNKEVYKI
jgi:hypothetical protein